MRNVLRLGVVAATAPLLFGCPTRAIDSELHLAGDREHFTFTVNQSTVEFPLDSPTAEAKRLQWLREYLTENDLCPNGHKVTDRQVIIKTHGLLGDLYTIDYRGECT